MTNHFTTTCSLCEGAGGRVVYESPAFRVIQAEEAGFPAFYRVVWSDHVAEFSDLSAAERAQCMAAVAAVEEALRDVLAPTKVNLAALGNQVPHLHWHVIARFDWDSHFPGPVWAGARQDRSTAHEAELLLKLPAVDAAITAKLKALGAA